MEDQEVSYTRVGRRHSDELRAAVLTACEAPGSRVSEVAARHGLNTNLVYKWLQRAGHTKGAPVSQTASAAAAFVPLMVEPPPAEPIAVAFCRRDITVRVMLPAHDVESAARLLRGVLL